MTTRTFAVPPLRGMLIAIILSSAVSAPAAATTNIPFSNFQGGWVATATYSPGDIVTYKGASYICLVQI